MRRLPFLLTAIAIGIGAPLVVTEIVLRFLPVTTGFGSQPVNETNPIFRFQPNRDFVWSKGWNFNIVNRGRVNNAGYVNSSDYQADETTPLLAVIGDSYVEAAMVPFADTLHGRLAAAVEESGRVYSFAASGAPLSQYLVWAWHASDVYRPDAMAFVIVGNDFDESLLASRPYPGFHYYNRADDGSLKRVRVDYQPPVLRPLIERSALLRYVYFNLEAWVTTSRLRKVLSGNGERSGEPARFLGNVPRTVDPVRLNASKSAVDAFFRDLPETTALAPERILFLVDGVRYPNNYDPGTYFVAMRRYFLERATSLGYGAIDMDRHFLPEHENNGTRFEFPTDAHWNAVSHRLAAEAIIGTDLFEKIFIPSNGL